jgi:hypothetical protein
MSGAAWRDRLPVLETRLDGFQATTINRDWIMGFLDCSASQKRWFIFRFLRRPLEILAEHTKI